MKELISAIVELIISIIAFILIIYGAYKNEYLPVMIGIWCMIDININDLRKEIKEISDK